MIISLEVAAIGSCSRVRAYIYRARSALGSRHTDYNHIFSFKFVRNRHAVSEDIAADFLSVVHHVLEILEQLMHIIKTLDIQ